MNDYLTVFEENSSELVIKKSRFISTIFHVESEEEALSIVNKVKAKYHDARHNVYGFNLINGISRYSEDGEPQGSAGVPTLNVLTNLNLFDCLIVTTRYFGGILLGQGGLAHAYSDSAKMCAESAKIVTMKASKRFSLKLDYSIYSAIESLIFKHNGKILETLYEEDVTIFGACPLSEIIALDKDIVNTTNGKISLNLLDECYCYE